jgi:hypothetical protein
MKRRWTPAGTPFQVEAWTKGLERSLAFSARALRRRAAYLDRLAAKIAGDREAGAIIDNGHVFQASDRSDRAKYYAAKLAGLSRYDRNALLEAVFPSTARRSDPAPSPTPGAIFANVDVVGQAVALVRSAACEDVDWTCEPLTESEAKVRQRYLERRLGSPLGPLVLRLEARALELRGKSVASDLAKALREASQRIDADDRARKCQELLEIRDELDDEAA